MKNPTIEFMRFVFCAVILFMHGNKIFHEQIHIAPIGYLAVEFFFIVSGYLMVQSCERSADTVTRLGEETVGFVWKKIRRLLLYIVIVYLVGVIISYCFQYSDLKGVTEHISFFLYSLFDLFLMNSSGIKGNYINGHLWYLSAMFLVMMVYYPVVRKYRQVFLYIAAPLLAVFLYGWMSQMNVTFSDPGEWTALGRCGLLRAAAGLALGCVSYAAAKYIRERKFTKNGIRWLTAAEISLYLIVLLLMQFSEFLKLRFLIFFFLTAAVSISFSGQSCLNRILQKRFVFWLGSISLPLYMAHFVVRYTMINLDLDLRIRYLMMIYLAGSILGTAFLMLAVRQIKKREKNS